MNDSLPRFTILTSRLNALRRRQAADIILDWIRKDSHGYVNVCTTDTVLKAYDDPRLADILNQSGLSVTDGMPLVWIARSHGLTAERVYGPDLMLDLCDIGRDMNIKHFFYGCTNDVLEKLTTRLAERFPGMNIVGTRASLFRPWTEKDKQIIAAEINSANPDIVWVGIGTPKQDFWISEFRPLLKAPALIAVGAAFNFHAGTVKQAPVWMRKSGLEWLFRLTQEPRRLARRYLIGNPRFIALWFMQTVGLLKNRHSGKQRKKI